MVKLRKACSGVLCSLYRRYVAVAIFRDSVVWINDPAIEKLHLDAIEKRDIEDRFAASARWAVTGSKTRGEDWSLWAYLYWSRKESKLLIIELALFVQCKFLQHRNRRESDETWALRLESTLRRLGLQTSEITNLQENGRWIKRPAAVPLNWSVASGNCTKADVVGANASMSRERRVT